MKKLLFVLLLLPQVLSAHPSVPEPEKDSSKSASTSLGFYFAQDMMWNQPGKMLTGYMARKSFFGFNIKNEKMHLSLFAGIGFKGFKFQLWTPRFTQEFMRDYAALYHPVSTQYTRLKTVWWVLLYMSIVQMPDKKITCLGPIPCMRNLA